MSSSLSLGVISAEITLGTAGLFAEADGALTALEGLQGAAGALDESLAALGAPLGEADAALGALDASAGGAASSLALLQEAAAGVDASVATEGGALAESSAAMQENAAAAGEDAAATDAAAASHDAAAGSISGAAGALKKLTMPLLAVGLVTAAVGIASVKMAGDFQAGVTTLVTGAGESVKNVKLVGDGILQLARDTGASTKDITDSMFMIESGGYHGAAGLNVERIAVEAAKVGNADYATTAQGIVGIMKDYASSHIDAAHAANVLVAGVANGMTHMTDFTEGLKTAMPTAEGFGVKLNDIAGAISTFTSEEVPAQQAGTFLRQMLMNLGTPGTAAIKMFKDVGLTTKQVSDEMKVSLPGTIKMITDAVGKKFPVGSTAYMEAIKVISGGSKTMQGMLDLSGEHLKDFQTNVGLVNDAVKQGGEGVTGWSNVQGDFNTKMSRAKEVVETLMISLGTHLLPVLGTLVDAFSTHLLPALSWVTSHFQQFEPILIPLAAVIGGALVAALWAAAVAAWAVITPMLVFAAPFIGAALGIMALVVAFKLAYDHITPFRIAVNSLVAVVKVVITVLGNLAGVIGHVFKQAATDAQVKTAEMRVGVVDHTIKMKEDAIFHTSLLRMGLIAQIAACKDPAKKHMLELKLGVFTHTLDMQEKSVQHAKEMRDQMLAHLKYMKENGIQHASEFAGGVFSAIGTWFHNLPGMVGGWLSNLGTTMHNKWTDMENRVVKFIANILSFFAGLPGDLLKIGTDMIQGLINGIGGMFDKVKKKIGDLAGLIPGPIKKLLGIGSPSKVFAEMGKNLGEGLLQGLFAQDVPGQVAAHLGQIANNPLTWPHLSGAQLGADALGTSGGAAGSEAGTGGAAGSGGLHVQQLIVQVQASSEDGSPSAAGTQFGRSFAAALDQTLRQKGY